VDDNQLRKIEPLAKQIKGVKSVEIKAATNSAAKPAAPDPSTSNVTKEQTNRN
jgi:hyperosmotically inducible periplasmic protein